MKRSDTLHWATMFVAPLGVLALAASLTAVLGLVATDVPADTAASRSWVDAARRAEQALTQRNISDAVHATQMAYAAALASRQWPGMIQAGRLYVAIGEVTGSPEKAKARAREAYLVALLRARRDASLEGVLRSAEAFAALGDHDVAEHALRIAARIAAEGPLGGHAAYVEMAERLRASAGMENAPR